MADIKKLFEKRKSEKILSNANLNKIGEGVESADYVKSNIKDKKTFLPHIDFTSASNFAKYGSAEKYYADSIAYITHEYPYDGSLKEKINWDLSSSYLDRYIFQNEYPRTNGYIAVGHSYGTKTNVTGDYDTFSTSQQEYILVKGTPHPITGSGDLRTNWEQYNLYSTSSTGRYNLEIDGQNGLAVEFWMNRNSLDSSESRRQVIFDLWNSGTFGSSTLPYGRFRVELTSSGLGNKAGEDGPVFNVELRSGSAGFSALKHNTAHWAGPHATTIALSSSVNLTGSWNHFALTFKNSDNQMVGKLFCNGQLADTLITGSSIGKVTGSMLGTIGSLVTNVSGTYAGIGAAKLSASLDEFRYWRRYRTPEQVGRNWFTQVGGGTNTDITNADSASTKYSYDNPVDLGVYYKFNEGITSATSTLSQDSVVLDYSGRTSNGAWTGYAFGSRFTGSAIILSKKAKSEFKDPIIYSNHPEVSSYKAKKTQQGKVYDYENNASIYNSIPAWILQEDEDKDRNTLKDLTQIISSYFDTLHLQIESLKKIKNAEYTSGSNKPYPFTDRLLNSVGLITSEIFSDASDLEYLASQDDHRIFEQKINETKNNIYKNIYNNLSHIYKSKGTEKSFRNLIRCYGVGEELVNLRIYGDNITHKLDNDFDFRVVKKRYADFHDKARFDATVFQQTSSLHVNSQGSIDVNNHMWYRGNTYEAETNFPTKLPLGDKNYVPNDFVNASIYGCHTLGTDNDWASSDYANFQVSSVRPNIYSKDAYFQLTGTSGGYFPSLTSSLFKDVYNDSRWNFAVRIKPDNYPYAASVSSSDVGDWKVYFSGYQYVLDTLVDSFTVSGSIDRFGAYRFMTHDKKFFVGAHRTNFDGATLQRADSRISSLRVWMDYLDNDTLKIHAKDVENFGSKHPYRNTWLSQMSKSLGNINGTSQYVPTSETLVLNWDFDTVTGSNASGEFVVEDASSGSVSDTSRWGWFGNTAEYQHTGRGYGFPTNETGSINRLYVQTAKQQLPETIHSSDMISLVDDNTRQLFTRESRPQDYYFAFEKSMYGAISEQMLNLFATIVDFNNLIGEPVNRYRQDYKDMEKLRSLYFERVRNTPDFKKFVDYFKWIDSSIGLMLTQLIPATSRFADKVRNMVESHILERNKYWTKFPTLESKASDPEGGLFGINEMLYPWKRGHSPVINSETGSNCFWWDERAKRDGTNITSGDSAVDTQRNTIRIAKDFRSGSGPNVADSWTGASDTTTITYEGQAYAIRNFTKPYKLTVDESPEYRGGSNFPKTKKIQWTHSTLKTAVNTGTKLRVEANSIVKEKQCNDVIAPNEKTRLEAQFGSNLSPDGHVSPYPVESYNGGNASIFAPFSLFSSSLSSSFLGGFKESVILTNYHDDSYGNDQEIPAQGPFTNAHVGGRQHRHARINTASADIKTNRAEAWSLTGPDGMITIGSVSPINEPQFPRATYLRDGTAKRPLNIRNIKWDTGSAVGGNYRKDYEIIQTSGRIKNNRYFVKAEGFTPFENLLTASSTYISGVVDFSIPRYDLTGTNKFIFVERFSAPGGPEVSRARLDVNAEEYGIYNQLNYRNLAVRTPLKQWYSEHCGQFGIDPGPNPDQEFQHDSAYKTNPLSYDGVVASFHKVNRNPVNIPAISESCDGGIFENNFAIMKIGNSEGTELIGSGESQPHLRVLPVSSSQPFPSLGAAGFSVSFWLTVTASYHRDRVLMSRWQSDAHTTTTTESDWRIYIPANETNQIKFEMIDTLTTTAKSAINSGTTLINPVNGAWHHVLCRYLRGGSGPTYNWTMDVYVDGSGSDTFTHTGVTNETTATGRTYIGAQYDTGIGYASQEATLGFGEGFLDEFAMWYNFDSPPGAAEAVLLYNNGCPTDLEQTIGVDTPSNWWRMGDGVGDGTADSSTALGSIKDQIGSNEVIIRIPKFANISGSEMGCPVISYVTCSTFATHKTQYDNWYVQHPIPRSDTRYHWITASILPEGLFSSSLVGHVDSRFSQPSGSVSSKPYTKLQFLSASEFGSYKGAQQRWGRSRHAGKITPTDFVGINYNLYEPLTSSTNVLGYPSTVPLMDTVSAVALQYINTTTVPQTSFADDSIFHIGETFNALMLRRNGPYQYPSWKQIRTGEHPIARYQRRNNLYSVMATPKVINLPNGAGSGNSTDYFDTRPDSFEQFIEPPVTFRYKALNTDVGIEGNEMIKLRHSHDNNLCLWSPGISTTQSVSDYRGEPGQTNAEQIHDKMMSDQNVATTIRYVSHNQTVYPREMNTGLNIIRGRKNYTEDAEFTVGDDHTYSSSLSNGDNGIDRGPLERRTFWRDNEKDRQRRSRILSGTNDIEIDTTLPNSQGVKNGYAAGVYGMGRTPIEWGIDDTIIADLSGGTGRGIIEYFPDTGELNSMNYHTFAGWAGTAEYSMRGAYISQATSGTWYPTCSAFYTHFPRLWTGANQDSVAMTPPKWRTSEISGKYPWFDSYAEYSSDIRSIAKNFTILPEFKISEHMNYYGDLEFRKQNNKFLSLPGAFNSTSSALLYTQPDGSRVFDEKFFNDYSHTDFQKYFGKFGNNPSGITLKCNAVKKLLPYHGFYPKHRSLQLASMFSQSIAPYIHGINWSASLPPLDSVSPSSGNLAVQSLLQPFFAPGIMYNTIKSGVAVDWAAMTGSQLSSALNANFAFGIINQPANFRIPFESILDPLGSQGLPGSGSNNDEKSKLALLIPTYQTGTENGVLDQFAAFPFERHRKPFVRITDTNRAKATANKSYGLYQLAMSNFLAEVPNFFLNTPGGTMKRIVSDLEQGQISLKAGKRYYMDIVLEKDPDLIMMEEYFNGERTAGAQAYDFEGRTFGPPFRAGSGTLLGGVYQNPEAPSYAPYTPPYFYGKSKMTIEYVATTQDEANFDFQRFFQNATKSYSNPVLDEKFDSIKGATDYPWAASSSAMQLTASLNTFGLFRPKQSRFNAQTGFLESVVDDPNADRSLWVISPKMETPVLDFASNTRGPPTDGPRGMWCGYGKKPTGNGIRFSVEPTFTGQLKPLAPNGGPSGSLVVGGADTEGFGTSEVNAAIFRQNRSEKIGEISDGKEISEAIVAIPYASNRLRSGNYAKTLRRFGKNFFSIDPTSFNFYRDWYLANKFPVDSNIPLTLDELTTKYDATALGRPFSNSIIKMITLMDKYSIPPEFDSLTYSRGAPHEKIFPVAMYMFEFNHTLKEKDLVDIWQGVMPDISRTAQLSNPEIDNNVFSHPTGITEFFGGKLLPEEIRWMVFKVKRKAKKDYYEMTADISDDNKFKNKFSVSNVKIPYSYNWPYDYFSLVELAEMEAEFTIEPNNTPAVNTGPIVFTPPVELPENVSTRTGGAITTGTGRSRRGGGTGGGGYGGSGGGEL